MSVRTQIAAGRLAELSEDAELYEVTLADGTELHAIRRSAREGYVDVMKVTPTPWQSGGHQTEWKYARLHEGERLTILD
jgi:hypothetical protein